MTEDRSGWSGDGEFTSTLLSALREVAEIEHIRVEDAPASRVEAGYNFLSNEVYVRFAPAGRPASSWLRRALASGRGETEAAMTLDALERRLAAIDGIGPADYADGSMLQYLRTERVIPPYQTRGYKVVELVRVYQAASRR